MSDPEFLGYDRDNDTWWRLPEGRGLLVYPRHLPLESARREAGQYERGSGMDEDCLPDIEKDYGPLTPNPRRILRGF